MPTFKIKAIGISNLNFAFLVLCRKTDIPKSAPTLPIRKAHRIRNDSLTRHFCAFALILSIPYSAKVKIFHTATIISAITTGHIGSFM